ncbi:hypothetical protein [Sorangium sp. So ce1335]|uniref:hypothetical protein n=1 Tax=Sorangium sp. So ce1335 TaxID=3133335 RepID=UPI003F607D42
MLSNVARFLMVSAAASLVALGATRAEADETCGEDDLPLDLPSVIHAGALSVVASNPAMGNGAVLFSLVQKNELWDHGDANVEEEWDEDDLDFIWGSISPSSEQYYDAFTDPAKAPAGGIDVTLISNVAQLAAGDVLVLDKTMTYSGHLAIINGPAQELTTQLNPKFSQTRQWAVPIIDSTGSKHGSCTATSFVDSRCVNGVFTQGPGTAWMRVYSDLSGNLLGHTWSVTSSSTGYYSQTERPYVVARLTTTECAVGHDDHPEP